MWSNFWGSSTSNEYQEKLFSEGDFKTLIKEKKIDEARAYLEKCANAGSFRAQLILIECYLSSEKNIAGIDFDYMSGYYVVSGYKFTGSTPYNKFLQIKQDKRKALELLASAMKDKNLYAALMFAIMQKNGVIFGKNEASAKALISEICNTSYDVDSVANIARFYYEMYFGEPNINVENLAVKFDKVINPKNAEYTFSPVESDSWNYVRVAKNDNGEEYKFISETRNEAFKSKGNKKLVPLSAIIDLHGTPELSSKIESIRLDGKYEFKITEKVCVGEDSQSVYQKYYSSYRDFDYKHLATLENGLQVLSTYDNLGGSSGSSRLLCIWALEKDKDGSYIIKKYGENFLFATAKDIAYDRIYIKNNVVVRYMITEMAVGFSPYLDILNFENDPVKYKQTISEILKEIHSN